MPDVGQKGTPDLVPLDQFKQSHPQETGSPAMSQDVEEEQPVPPTPDVDVGEPQKRGRGRPKNNTFFRGRPRKLSLQSPAVMRTANATDSPGGSEEASPE